jgi:hypothetical protein
MSLESQQVSLAEEAVQSIIKYHGYTDKNINSSLQYNNSHQTFTSEPLTPPDDINLYRANCIELSYNDKYEDELYLTQQKVKNLEKALRLAKEKIGDLWMELYNERQARKELEERYTKITFV